MNYELKHIRGIPYYIDGTTVHIFELGSTGRPSDSCVAIGLYDAATDSITYFADWRERVQPNLIKFRENITPQERDKLRSTIVKPQKQRKPRAAPRKNTRTKNIESK